ncbi:MAG: alpha/beta hydrolase [Gemmatimonadota bacterium]
MPERDPLASPIQEVRIPSGEEQLSAGIHAPDGPGPHPTVLLGHGFGATRSAGLERYAARFREAGLLAVTFDYRHFGGSSGEPRQLLSVSRQLEDWRAMLAWARERPEVDARRIGIWGSSFAGGHVLRIAAEDPAVAAVVSQVPFTNGVATTLRLPLLSVLKATVVSSADVLKGIVGAAPVTMPLVAPPGQAAAMPLDEAVEGFRRMNAHSPWTNRVCARIGLAVPFYHPGRAAGRIQCPLLMQIGERDALTPPGPARRAGARAPMGRVVTYPFGHFEVYFDEAFERVVGDQIEFLTEHLMDSHPTDSHPRGPHSRPP